MAGNVDSLRSLFLKLSQQILVEEQRSLYGLVKDKQIPARTLQGLVDTDQVFIKLEELGYIGYTNLTLLKDLLGKINREPLVRLVEEFERKQQENNSISQPPGGNTDFDEVQREPIVHLVEESETRQHGSQSVSQQAEHGNQSVGQQDGLDTDLDEFQLEPLVQSVEEPETRQHGSQSISQQQRNQNVGQQDGMNTDNSKMTSIFLAERWSNVWDTVSALNCQLASLAAQNKQNQILSVVLKATKEEENNAAYCGVELILPCLCDDIRDVRENDAPSFKWLQSPDIYFSTLTKLQNVDYIVEHVKSSTSFLFAPLLRKRCFKDANIVLINHASPSADLRDKHLKFVEAAAAVFSVGPTVFEEYKKLYESTNIPIKHAVYLPRPENAACDLNADQMARTISSLNQMLTVITDKKIESTRFQVLFAAICKTARLYHSMYNAIPTWFVRVISGMNVNDMADFLRNNLKGSYIDVNTSLPYGSQDDIYRDFEQSNVLVIPPDEPFRMEALWAIAAGLPVLVPRRTTMAEFLKYCFGNHAEYFLYEPSVDDLSDKICKMLKSPETISVTRQLKDAFHCHSEIKRSHENFKSCLAKTSQPNVPVGAVSPESHVFPDEASTSQVQSAPVPERKQPYMPMSPESHVFPDEASTSQVQSAPVPERKQPYMPTICCEANLEIAEKKMKMETTLLMERERQQFELQKERDRHQLELQKERVNQQLELQRKTHKQKLKHKKESNQQQLETDNMKMLQAKIKELYELQVETIIARNSPDKDKELENAYEKFKARLDKIAEGSLQFMLSFLSEEDIDYFWQKYMAAEVEEVISNILITPEMRLLVKEASFTVRIKLKIDKKEYELVKEILHDISAVYTVSKITWVRTIAFNEWERYVLNHVHENQAEYLIQQSRFHPILSELRDDEFFFPSFVSYWYESMYNLPSTLTEATEYAIKLCLPLKQLEVRNVFKTAEDTLHEIGKQAFENYPQRPSSLIQLAYSHDRTGSFLFDLSNNIAQYRILFFIMKPPHSMTFWNQFILVYFYALAVYWSKMENAMPRRLTLEICVKSIPNILIFVAGILKEKATNFFILLTYTISKAYPVNMGQLSLLGCCLLESKCPEKFIGIVQHLMKPQSLDLSTSDFDDISHYRLESVASILKLTSIVEKLVLVAENEMSSLSESFNNLVKFQMDNASCDVAFPVNNMMELKVVARFIKFHKLFITQRSVRHRSQTTIKSITIKATEDISYHESYRTGKILIRALASCSYLKLLHLSGFKKTFVTMFLQTIIRDKIPLTVTRMELLQNELDNSSVKVILEATKFFPLLEELDVRNNKLGCTGSVALLPLADKVSVFIENNGVEENLDRLFKCKEVLEQISHLRPYVSDIKTIDDIKKLQSTSEHVTKLNIQKSLPEMIGFVCSSLALFTDLKELDFSGCGITEDDAIILADQFDYLSELEHVNLSSNNIGDIGVNYVAVKLDDLKNFKSADFSRTNISLRGMIDLHRTIQMSHHENINVAGNLTELVYVLPHIECKLHNYPLDVDLQEKRITLDKLSCIKELDEDGERVSISKNWDKTEFKHFCEGLSILYMVRYLKLSKGNIGEVGADDFRKAMERITELSYLSLSHNNIGEDTAQTIARGFPNLTNLMYLDLSHNNIQDVGAMKVIRGTWKLNNLRNLNLSHNNIQGFDAQIVNEGTENIYALEDLDLSNNSIGNEGAESLSMIIKFFSLLKNLSLSHNNIEDDGACSIGRGVTKLTKLIYLDLSNNKIKDFGAAHVVRGIGKLNSVRNLDLSHNNIHSFDAQIVIEGIENGYAIEYLDLSNNSIGREGVESLNTRMELFSQLKYLSLSHNNIEDDCAKRLSRGMVKLNKLKHIVLSHNNIGDIGAEEVIRQIGNLVYLERIDLSHNRIGDTFAEIFSEVINFMAQSVSQDHEHADDKAMQLQYLDLQYNYITDSGAHLLKSTIENTDLFVDLHHNEISNNPEYLGKQPTSGSEQAPGPGVFPESVIHGPYIWPKLSESASHSDSAVGRSSAPTSKASTDGKDITFTKYDRTSTCAISDSGISHSSAKGSLDPESDI